MYGQWTPQMQAFQKSMKGAMRAASLQTVNMRSSVPEMAQIAQLIRRREKEAPGLFADNSAMEQPKNRVARLTGKKKIDIFGGMT